MNELSEPVHKALEAINLMNQAAYILQHVEHPMAIPWLKRHYLLNGLHVILVNGRWENGFKKQEILEAGGQIQDEINVP